MATGFPSSTGDVLSAAMYNGLVNFTTSTNTGDYTAVLNDQYQTLEIMNKATAIAFKIPTNASVAFPIGTVITVLTVQVSSLHQDWHRYLVHRGGSIVMIANNIAAVNGFPVTTPVVTGGTLTSDATYYYRTFTSNGTLALSGANISIDYCVVGGGGGTGGSVSGSSYPGAGAAGIVVQATGATLTVGNHAVTVGAGGVGTLTDGVNGSTGGSSSLVLSTTITATGGGGGNIQGGAGGYGGSNASYSGGLPSAVVSSGGGGAGSSGNGSNAPVQTTTGGNGGPGTTPTIIADTIAGGGSGTGSTTAGTTTAGGGRGGPTNTAASKYGAGTGARDTIANATGYPGVVVVRYLKSAV